MIGSLLRVPEPAANPAARFSRAGRIGAATTLVLGDGLQLAAFSIEPASEATIDRLRWIADNPGQANLAKLCDLLAMPFLLGSGTRLRAALEEAFATSRVRSRHPARHRTGRPDSRARL